MPVSRLPIAAVAAAVIAGAPACSSGASPAPAEVRLRLWHAFSPEETRALDQALAHWQRDRGVSVAPIRQTFARAQTTLRRALTDGETCSDLARIDATWLPGVAELLAPRPAEVGQSRRWLPAARRLGRIDGVSYGLPQAIDGLALLYRKQAVQGLAWPPSSMDELVTAAQALTRGPVFGLGVRSDGYWFVPFVRAWGGGLVAPATGRLGIDAPASLAALERFAALFGSVAPPPSATATEASRFRDGTTAVVISGPWAIAEMTGGDTADLDVAALPGAPLGGQILVVPRCAAHPALAWQLAEYLTSPAVQVDWAARLGVLPTSHDSLERAEPFVQRFYQALSSAQPLPRHPVTAELFDDLNPALSRVIAGEATPREAVDVVARAWSRLLRNHGIEPVPHRSHPPPTPHDASP